MRFYFLVAAALFTAGCSGPAGNNASTPSVNNGNSNNKPKPVATVSSYEVVRKYPHDGRAFTQGLVFRNGFLYESTGEYGESTLRKVELDTGRVVQKHDLPPEVFAEGIAIMGDKIYQLSWKNRTAWIYDLDFKLQREVRYAGEGWGLATAAFRRAAYTSKHDSRARRACSRCTATSWKTGGSMRRVPVATRRGWKRAVHRAAPPAATCAGRRWSGSARCCRRANSPQRRMRRPAAT